MLKQHTAAELPCRHGGDAAYDFHRLGIKPLPVVDFSVNINPLGPPVEILDEWNGMAMEIARYPSVTGDKVKQFYEQRFGLTSDCVLPGNGSIELIYLIPRVLRFRHVVLLIPCFYDYYNAAHIAGSEISCIRLSAEDEFASLSIEELEDTITGADAIFIGNPNNPTGTIFQRETILDLAERYPQKWFLLDEAFIQFVENYEQITLIRRKFLRPNILVFHSLTKFYALPGLRLGAVIGHPAVISRLGACKEPWTVNSIAERIAGILIRCRDYEETTRRLIHAEQRRLFPVLKNIPGIRTFAPKSNFFLAQLTTADCFDDFLRHLMSNGIYVRDCRNFQDLEHKYFRFTIRNPAENDLLLDVISRFSGRKDG